MLRDIVDYVTHTKAFIGEDHGLPNFGTRPVGGPFFPGSKLNSSVLLGSHIEGEEFSNLIVKKQRINLYLVVPLTGAEMDWKREVGAEKSVYNFVGSRANGHDEVMVDSIINPTRPCAVEDLGAREIYKDGAV